MPDISMCANDDNCLARGICYRSEHSGTHPTERRQAYMNFEPDKAESCEGFIPSFKSPKPAPQQEASRD